jgi:hypothetical protein
VIASLLLQFGLLQRLYPNQRISYDDGLGDCKHIPTPLRRLTVLRWRWIFCGTRFWHVERINGVHHSLLHVLCETESTPTRLPLIL